MTRRVGAALAAVAVSVSLAVPAADAKPKRSAKAAASNPLCKIQADLAPILRLNLKLFGCQ